MKMLKHKGYFGSIEASIEDNCLFGKLEFISPLINYEGETIAKLETAFKEAVEDYLSDCAVNAVEPATPCKGSFNVRIGHKLHLAAMVAAKENNVSLNDFVKRQVESGINH